jgi:hypothetical protein
MGIIFSITRVEKRTSDQITFEMDSMIEIGSLLLSDSCLAMNLAGQWMPGRSGFPSFLSSAKNLVTLSLTPWETPEADLICVNCDSASPQERIEKIFKWHNRVPIDINSGQLLMMEHWSRR